MYRVLSGDYTVGKNMADNTGWQKKGCVVYYSPHARGEYTRPSCYMTCLHVYVHSE